MITNFNLRMHLTTLDKKTCSVKGFVTLNHVEEDIQLHIV
jgi:hypothetical protein